MISDLRNDLIVFHYIGTKDIGLQNIININPLKLIGFLDSKSIVVRERNIRNVFFNGQMDSLLYKHLKEENNKDINYKCMFEEISGEVQKLVDAHIK